MTYLTPMKLAMLIEVTLLLHQSPIFSNIKYHLKQFRRFKKERDGENGGIFSQDHIKCH